MTKRGQRGEADIYIRQMRGQLRLVQLIAFERLKWCEGLPVGHILRNNWIKHTQALIGLLEVASGLAAHDPLVWYEDDPELPL